MIRIPNPPWRASWRATVVLAVVLALLVCTVVLIAGVLAAPRSAKGADPAESPCAPIEGERPCSPGHLNSDLAAQKRSELIEQGLYAFPGQPKAKPKCETLEQNLRELIRLAEWRAGWQAGLGMMANQITDATRQKIGAAMDRPDIRRMATAKFGGAIDASAQGVLMAAGCGPAKGGF